MKVEGLTQAIQAEPVRLDPQKQAGNTGKELNTAQKEKEPKANLKEVKNAVELLNRTMESYNTELKFTLHEKSGEYMVKVINTTDNSVIREIPPQRVLDMVAHFKELLGLIVDKFI